MAGSGFSVAMGASPMVPKSEIIGFTKVCPYNNPENKTKKIMYIWFFVR
jgi:hypothetical protein